MQHHGICPKDCKIASQVAAIWKHCATAALSISKRLIDRFLMLPAVPKHSWRPLKTSTFWMLSSHWFSIARWVRRWPPFVAPSSLRFAPTGSCMNVAKSLVARTTKGCSVLGLVDYCGPEGGRWRNDGCIFHLWWYSCSLPNWDCGAVQTTRMQQTFPPTLVFSVPWAGSTQQCHQAAPQVLPFWPSMATPQAARPLRSLCAVPRTVQTIPIRRHFLLTHSLWQIKKIG